MSSISRLTAITGHMSSPTVSSVFEPIQLAPTDPIFGLMAAYKADIHEKKVDLGIGAYRGDNAKPWVLPVVQKADGIIRNDPNLNHEYLPIAGLPEFTSAAARLVLGADSQVIKEKRVCSLQTISGTGAVHLGALFLSKFYPKQKNAQKSSHKVYIPNPTWVNHVQIFGNVHLETTPYPYWDPNTKGLAFEGFCQTVENAPEGSIILLHACAHNPTGVDPTREQWTTLATIMRRKNHFPFFDTAYQGFASGDPAQDAWSIRHFAEQGFEMCIAQSFAKNFGLYGQRVGCFHFISLTETVKINVASQLAIIQRSEISNPPAYGARIASLVLNDEVLFREWEDDLRTMSGRIIDMRKALYNKLVELGTPGDWGHILKQIGMFSFTGLTEPQVLRLREEAHVYLTKNGRISMAGLNSRNVEYFAHAVDKVVRESM